VPLTQAQSLRYGLMGLPLAFLALPLYMLLPNHYAREYGMSLAALGAVLLATRALDAVVDPSLGRWCDALYRRSARHMLGLASVLCVLMGLGFGVLFFPPWMSIGQAPDALSWVWLSVALVATYLSFSATTLMHQSWGALLAGGELQQSRLAAWREGLALLGVVLASVAPSLWGLPTMVGLFGVVLALGLGAWWLAPQPAAAIPVQALPSDASWRSLWQPLQRPAFRKLLCVCVVNGTASAIPATLLFFFLQDRLQVTSAQEPLFLGGFFVTAALSIPGWMFMVRRWGLVRSWWVGMMLAVCVFAGAVALEAGDALPFLWICALSGMAQGADLALPGALLAGLIAREGDLGRSQGTYMGWWNFVIKLNLALAAGLSLPLLAWAGYVPGTRELQGLQALTLAYAVVPCMLKVLAAVLLYVFFVRPTKDDL